MKDSTALDTTNGDGFWTVDNWSYLTGLAAYKYICNTLGNTSEATWANNEYNSLLTAVNNTLAATMAGFGINYIPPGMFDSNGARDPKDANWASMFMFGRWAWDAYLFGANQSGVSFTKIDSTYDAGFLAGLAAGLAPHNFGAFPGYSSVYNAGFGSAALRGEKYRSEGIYAYQFMIANGQSGPFCWHESFFDPVPSSWQGTHPRAAIVGDSPHMWGQANATKVLIDSLIAEKTDGSVVIGRGVPNSWVTSTQTISLSNFPIANNNRMGFTVQGTGNGQIVLTLTGAVPSGGTVLDLRALLGNIGSVTAGTIDNVHGTVTLAPGVTTTTVTLINPNPTPIPTPTPAPASSPRPIGGTLTEAESGALKNCYLVADPNASGGYMVGGIDQPGDNVTLTGFPAASRIKIRYATPYTGTFGLYANNIRIASIPIANTGGWFTYAEKTLNLNPPILANSIVKFQYDSGDVPINLDYVISNLIEMEEGHMNNGAFAQADYYASAGNYVRGLFDHTSPPRSVSFNSGEFPAVDQFSLRYSSFYSQGGESTVSLYINNVKQSTIHLPDTAKFDGISTYAWSNKDVDLTIQANDTVTFQFDPDDVGGAEFDCISLVRKSEAEAASLSGFHIQYDPNASGSNRVDIDSPYPSTASISFTNAQRGSRIVFRYATALPYGLMKLYVNGQFKTYVFFRSTGAPNLFADKVAPVSIPAAATVKLQYDTGDSPVNLDYIRIDGGVSTVNQ